MLGFLTVRAWFVLIGLVVSHSVVCVSRRLGELFCYVPQICDVPVTARIPFEIKLKIDQIANRFEDEWSCESSVNVDAYLSEIDDEFRSSLLETLIGVDIELRLKARQAVEPGNYKKWRANAIDIAQKVVSSKQEYEAITVAPANQNAENEAQGALDIPNGLKDFEDYEILEEIARGGMGVVYKAYQKSLRRTVAIKMILSGQMADEKEISRFRIEAESAAGLDHPGIVKIIEIGEAGGQQFFSMGFVNGPSLADLLANGPLEPDRAVGLLKKIAEAIGYAHSKGVVHRDLKPANVLIDEHGEPRITDFGLAKSKTIDSSLTATGQIIGTPSYMSPEQVVGDRETIGNRSDIYSMGAILYEMLAGRPPFKTDNLADTFAKIIEDTPESIGRLNPKIDRDLEAVCLKCLKKNPDLRYSNAGSLVADLDRYSSGEEVIARKSSVFGRLGRLFQFDKFDPRMHRWATILFLFAIIIGVAQLGLFVVISSKQPLWAVFSTQAFQFFSMAIVLFCFRSQQLLPINPVERQLWSLWLGFVSACILIAAISHKLVDTEILYNFFLYPYWSITSGLAFIVMGGQVWGRFYIIGCTFFLIALLQTFVPPMGPFTFGLLWIISLVIMARQLKSKVST